MRITYVKRSFLDYCVPVYRELDLLTGNQLHVVFPDTHVPERVRNKIKAVLGDRAVEMTGEKSLGRNRPSRDFANASWVIPYQPGLLKAIHATRPDVVVGDGFFQWSLPGLAYRALHRKRFVMCYERTFHTERKAQWYRSAYRRLVSPWIDSVCCNGKLCAEYTQSLGFSPDVITTGGMAADSENLQQTVDQVTTEASDALRAKHNILGTCFLFVGQLIPRKGVAELLRGWAQFNADHSEATLLLVGDGHQRDELQALTQSLNLQNVHFAGAVDYDSIAPYYAMADVMVMPTLEDNWSLVVPEAMACRLPILCSIYNGGWPELVKDGENGWTFDPLSPDSVAQALQQMQDRKNALDALGQKSFEIVQDFTPAQAAKAIYRACEIALNR
ncbi:MAG: glycosyltransferase family 4 protein [Planctomycetota bacterium]